MDVREHITDHGLRRRVSREATRAARFITVAIGTVAIGLLCTVYLLFHVDRSALGSSSMYSFAVADATAVKPGLDEVLFKGIPAGRITGVHLQGTQPVVTISLQNGFGRIYRNATAELRPNTPLQDMYLDITSRGTPTAGQASANRPVPAIQTDTSVSISSVLDVFRADERSRMSELLDALGNGLSDRGAQLRTAFVELVPFLEQAGRISEQLDLRRTLTQQLIHNSGLLTTTLGQRAGVIRQLVTQGSQVMRTLGGSSPALDQTLSALPPTIDTAQHALQSLSDVLPNVNGAARSLDHVADHLPQSLAAVRRLATVATPAVKSLQTPVARLVPLTSALEPVAAHLQSSTQTLLPQTPVLVHTVQDVNGCLPALYGFFDYDASMAKFGDARGGGPRGNVAIGPQMLGIKNGFEFAPQACTPGTAIGGRMPIPSDYH